MLFADSLLRQLAREKTHFHGQEQTLFRRHRPLDLESKSLCGGAGVSDDHGTNTITRLEKY
jgi:hypothetical protein